MKKVYLSSEANESLKTYLTNLGYSIETVNYDGSTYYPVCTHPDIFMCRLGLWESIDIFPGNHEKLRPEYPGNIIYNAVCTEKYFIHNLKYTDHELLAFAAEWKASHSGFTTDFTEKTCKSSADKLLCVDVPQGYTRCCLLPVDDTSFITSDIGIANALISAGADVLVIEKGHIELTGFNYGFIGGCAGHIMLPQLYHNYPHTDINNPCDVHIIRITATSDMCSIDTSDSPENAPKKAIIFNGNLSAHPDYASIKSFITKRNTDIIYFENYPLTDIGSILALW